MCVTQQDAQEMRENGKKEKPDVLGECCQKGAEAEKKLVVLRIEPETAAPQTGTLPRQLRLSPSEEKSQLLLLSRFY